MSGDPVEPAKPSDLQIRRLIVGGLTRRFTSRVRASSDQTRREEKARADELLIRDWCVARTAADFEYELDELRAGPPGIDREASVRILATIIRYWSSSGAQFTADGKPAQPLIAQFGVTVAERLSGSRLGDDDHDFLLSRWQTPEAAIGRDRFHGEVDHGDLTSRNLAIAAFVERESRRGVAKPRTIKSAALRFGYSIQTIRSACTSIRQLGLNLTDTRDWTDAALDELLAPWARRMKNQTPL